MKIYSTEKFIFLTSAFLAGLIEYQSVLNNIINNTNKLDSKENQTNSKMTYGRFLEHLDMGWVKKVDFYENGRIAMIEDYNPELSDRTQKIQVEIPVGDSPLVNKLRTSKIDFTSHPSFNLKGLINQLNSIFIPFFILLGLMFLFRRSMNFMGGPGQLMNFRKARAKVQTKLNTGVFFDDLAGIDEVKEEFQEVVTFLKKPQRFITVGAKIPKGIILIGSPGTGKTLLAKAIAGEAGVPFISISGSEFVEMFVGIGASRVRDLFKTAQQNAPCIVFIDEIDAIARQRGAGIGGGNDEREQTLNQILTEMDGFRENTGIIVIGATNRVDVLDGALLRPGRFDRQVNINLPDLRGRIEILKVHIKNKKLSDDVSLKLIARRTPGFSGADLANLLNEAAIVAARQDKLEITLSEINVAIDRVIAGLEGKCLSDTKNKRLIAYHEVGHAVVGTLLQYHDDVQKVTLIPRGQAKGFTWFTPSEDQVLISRSQLVARIIGTLAGRAAEEVVFGPSEITTGANNDLLQITRLTRQMVTRFGMSTVGPISLSSNVQQVFIGRLIRSNRNSNELSIRVSNKIDDQVTTIIQYCYDQAMDLIKQNRFLIDQLVNDLIQEETIEGNQFRKHVEMYAKLPRKVVPLLKINLTQNNSLIIV
jgi:cell division protease FtsH